MGYRIRFYAEGAGAKLFYIGGHIAQRRVRAEMAECLRDHCHIIPGIDHLVSQAVAQQVRPFADATLADAAEGICVVGHIRHIGATVLSAMAGIGDETVLIPAHWPFCCHILIDEVPHNGAKREDYLAQRLALTELDGAPYPVYIRQLQVADILAAHTRVQEQGDDGPVPFGKRASVGEDERLQLLAVLMSEGFIYLTDSQLLGKVMEDGPYCSISRPVSITAQKNGDALGNQGTDFTGAGIVSDMAFLQVFKAMDSRRLEMEEE